MIELGAVVALACIIIIIIRSAGNRETTKVQNEPYVRKNMQKCISKFFRTAQIFKQSSNSTKTVFPTFSIMPAQGTNDRPQIATKSKNTGA